MREVDTVILRKTNEYADKYVYVLQVPRHIGEQIEAGTEFRVEYRNGNLYYRRVK